MPATVKRNRQYLDRRNVPMHPPLSRLSKNSTLSQLVCISSLFFPISIVLLRLVRTLTGTWRFIQQIYQPGSQLELNYFTNYFTGLRFASENGRQLLQARLIGWFGARNTSHVSRKHPTTSTCRALQSTPASIFKN